MTDARDAAAFVGAGVLWHWICPDAPMLWVLLMAFATAAAAAD